MAAAEWSQTGYFTMISITFCELEESLKAGKRPPKHLFYNDFVRTISVSWRRVWWLLGGRQSIFFIVIPLYFYEFDKSLAAVSYNDFVDFL